MVREHDAYMKAILGGSASPCLGKDASVEVRVG